LRGCLSAAPSEGALMRYKYPKFDGEKSEMRSKIAVSVFVVSLLVVTSLLANVLTTYGYLSGTSYSWDPSVPNYNPSAVIHTGTIDTSSLVMGDFLGVSAVQPSAWSWGDSGVSVGWDDTWVSGVGDGNTNGDNLDGLWSQIYSDGGWWNLGFATTQVVVFTSQDHGPYLGEGIEYRVYGTNTLWDDTSLSPQASLTDVYLDGWHLHNPAEDFNGNGWCSDDISGVFQLDAAYRYIKLVAWGGGSYTEPEIDAVAAMRLRTLDKMVYKKVKMIPAPMQFWVQFLGYVKDVILFDPPEITEGVAIVRDYAVLTEMIPLELLTWEGTQHLPWKPIDHPSEPCIIKPGGTAEFDITTPEGTGAVLVRYTVAWESTRGIIEVHFVNEAIIEDHSPQAIVGQLSNFDVHQDYPEPVDNFELELYGIKPSDIVDVFPGWGTPPQIDPIPGGTEIIWIGPPVPYSQWVHFGVHLIPDVKATGVKAYWTQRPSAELGEPIHTKITVTVPSGETATVVDTLPPELKYISGTFSVDGVSATPTVTTTPPPPPRSEVISYTLTTPGTHVIKFKAKVTSAYWEDRKVCNKAVATWYDAAGNMIETKEDIECFTIHPFEELRKKIVHEDWPMFHHDLALSGVSGSKAPNTNATLWTYDTGTSVTSSPAIVDGRLYIGDLGVWNGTHYNGTLYALDANTGALLWTYTTGGSIYSSPAVAYGKVYFLSTDGNFYALNAVTGALVWSKGGMGGGWPWSSPAVHNGRVFVATGNGWVHSLDAGTGAVIPPWPTFIGGNPNGPIAVVNGKVYSGTHNFDATNPTLVALDELTGAIIWNYNHTAWNATEVGMINSNGVSVADGDGDGDLEVYFGIVTWNNPPAPSPYPTGKAIALDEATGVPVWMYTFRPITAPSGGGPGWSTSTPAVHAGKVFIGSDDAYVYALDAGTGAWVWEFQTGDAVWSAPAVADGKVFVASLDHIFYALDETTGNLIWKYDTSASRMEGSPAVACGKVFVGNENGKVYAWGSSTDSSLTIKEKTDVQWTFEIKVTNPFSYTMTNVVVSDNFGAEIEIDEIVLMADPNGDAMIDALDLSLVSKDYGTKDSWDLHTDFNKDGKVNLWDLTILAQQYGSYASWELILDETGKSQKVHLKWYIGNLAPGKTAQLILLVSTDINPAGHQEYTTPGVYEMNSGATLKFIDPEQDMQLSAVTAPIYVTVLPAEDC